MALGWRGSYLRYKSFFLNISELYKKRADFRAFIEIVLSISTIIIFLLFALKPTAITIVNLLQEIKQKKETLSALTQKEKNLRIAEALLTQYQTYLPDIDTAVPSVVSPDLLVKQIEGLATKDSVNIVGISVNQVTIVGTTPKTVSPPGAKAAPENASKMPFSVSIKGSYPDLMTFIKDFENLRVITKIDDLEISSSTTNQGRAIVAVISGWEPFLPN
jgi:Tfp pilus assembly protein PilO